MHTTFSNNSDYRQTILHVTLLEYLLSICFSIYCIDNCATTKVLPVNGLISRHALIHNFTFLRFLLFLIVNISASICRPPPPPPPPPPTFKTKSTIVILLERGSNAVKISHKPKQSYIYSPLGKHCGQTFCISCREKKREYLLNSSEFSQSQCE